MGIIDICLVQCLLQVLKRRIQLGGLLFQWQVKQQEVGCSCSLLVLLLMYAKTNEHVGLVFLMDHGFNQFGSYQKIIIIKHAYGCGRYKRNCQLNVFLQRSCAKLDSTVILLKSELLINILLPCFYLKRSLQLHGMDSTLTLGINCRVK